jgi:hypothetical protein
LQQRAEDSVDAVLFLARVAVSASFSCVCGFINRLGPSTMYISCQMKILFSISKMTMHNEEKKKMERSAAISNSKLEQTISRWQNNIQSFNGKDPSARHLKVPDRLNDSR